VAREEGPGPSDVVTDFIAWVGRVPHWAVYAGLGVGAAIENVVPAVPADSFIAVGGFLSTVSDIDARWVFGVTWLCNVASAVAMYRLGYLHGRPFFEHGWGRGILRRHQMERMARFYDRWGTPAIFFTRFLPGLRAVVPVFAGVSHQPALFVALPIAVASAIWYGALVWLGALAGRNLDGIRSVLGRVNEVLLPIAVVVAVLIGVWWWRTRRSDDG
jgi:membrane protein DedA with SNARE-associated domain